MRRAWYGLYRTREGNVALTALEPHFWERLLEELWVDGDERRDLERTFETETAKHWRIGRRHATSRSPRCGT